MDDGTCPKLIPNLKCRLYEAVAGGICTQIGLGLKGEFLTCLDNGCVPGIPATPRPWILHCHVRDLVKWAQKTSKGEMLLRCGLHMLSTKGRCFTFDESEGLS